MVVSQLRSLQNKRSHFIGDFPASSERLCASFCSPVHLIQCAVYLSHVCRSIHFWNSIVALIRMIKTTMFWVLDGVITLTLHCTFGFRLKHFTCFFPYVPSLSALTLAFNTWPIYDFSDIFRWDSTNEDFFRITTDLLNRFLRTLLLFCANFSCEMFFLARPRACD